MTISKRLLLSFLVLSLFSFAFSPFAYVYAKEDSSQADTSDSRDWKIRFNVDKVKDSIRHNVEKFTCKNTEERISKRIEKFEANKDRHVNSYQNITESIEKALKRAQEAGKDTSQLEADLKTLDELIRQFATDYSAFIDKLKESQGFPCGESQGDFRLKMAEVKDLAQKVREDAKAIKDFIKNTIRPDIKALKGSEEDKMEGDN